MTRVTNLFRRGAVYYFRRRIRWKSGRTQAICLSLGTRCLSVARQRAIHLSAACERLRARLESAAMDQFPSADQQAQVFRNQLLAERDALQALYVDLIIHDQPCSKRTFVDSLDVMELVTNRWFEDGPPSRDGIEDAGGLPAYVAQVFPSLDEVDQDWLCLSLGDEAIIAHWLHLGTEAALRTVGAPVTDRGRAAAARAIYGAKLEAIRDIRAKLQDPSAWYQDHILGEAPEPRQWDVFDTIWHEPLYQLMNMCPPADAAPSDQPSDGPREAPSTPDVVSTRFTRLTIVEAAEIFIEEMPASSSRWDPKSVKQFRAAAMLAGKAIPGAIAQVVHHDILRLNTLFMRLPKSHHKSDSHETMSLEEIVAEAAEALKNGSMSADEIGLAAVTTNRHFRFLRRLFDWAAREVPALKNIHWEDLIAAEGKNARDARPSLTVAQAIALFHLAVWTGCASEARRYKAGSQVIHDAAYWVPLLLWYTAGRREEICKLLCSDVVQIVGVWCIEINFTETGRIKNESSCRPVPLHDELLRLGFLEFVDAIRATNHSRLFPELVTASSPSGDIWYDRNWPKIKRALPDVIPGQCPHSIRHAIGDELKDKRVFPEFRKDLLGHSPGQSDTENRYAKNARVKRLLKVLKRIPVVTRHLERRPITLNSQVVATAPPGPAATKVSHQKPALRLVWPPRKGTQTPRSRLDLDWSMDPPGGLPPDKDPK